MGKLLTFEQYVGNKDEIIETEKEKKQAILNHYVENGGNFLNEEEIKKLKYDERRMYRKTAKEIEEKTQNIRLSKASKYYDYYLISIGIVIFVPVLLCIIGVIIQNYDTSYMAILIVMLMYFLALVCVVKDREIARKENREQKVLDELKEYKF